MLYFALVYLRVLYSVEIYGNTCSSNPSRLNKLNNKIRRILWNESLSTHNTDLYKHDTLPATAAFIIFYKPGFALCTRCT